MAEEAALRTHEQAVNTLRRAKTVVEELRATIEGFPTSAISGAKAVRNPGACGR